jgi:hypothetical protein
MYLRRVHVIALVAALVALAGYVVVPKVSSAIHNHEASDALAAADASFAHLKVPADFVALSSNPDCQWYPCYRVPRPTTSVVKQLPAILKSTGAHAYYTLRKACPAPRRPGLPVLCAFGGISHGYQVLIFLGAPPASCTPKPCHLPRNESIVQINPPYIPADAEPENGGSGWPIK